MSFLFGEYFTRIAFKATAAGLTWPTDDTDVTALTVTTHTNNATDATDFTPLDTTTT